MSVTDIINACFDSDDDGSSLSSLESNWDSNFEETDEEFELIAATTTASSAPDDPWNRRDSVLLNDVSCVFSLLLLLNCFFDISS